MPGRKQLAAARAERERIQKQARDDGLVPLSEARREFPGGTLYRHGLDARRFKRGNRLYIARADLDALRSRGAK